MVRANYPRSVRIVLLLDAHRDSRHQPSEFRSLGKADLRPTRGRQHGPRFLPEGLGLDGLGAAGPRFKKRIRRRLSSNKKWPYERERSDAIRTIQIEVFV
jgi:hypothetical protein